MKYCKCNNEMDLIDNFVSDGEAEVEVWKCPKCGKQLTIHICLCCGNESCLWDDE